MRKLIGTSLLVLSLSCAAYAGDIPFDVAGDMPFPVGGDMPVGINNPQPNGDMPFDRQGAATEAVLNVLGSVLSLF